MTFDPKGTTPGLDPAQSKDKTVNMKCKKCPSMDAVVVDIGGDGSSASHNRLYRCVKCNYSWGVSVGGNVNL